MTLTLNQFVAIRYKEYPLLKKYYSSAAAYRENYVASHGFGEWLNTLKDQVLSFRQTVSLVMSYMKYGNRKTTDLPHLFGLLQRLYRIEFPVREGIFTTQYWDVYFSQKK